MSVPELPDDFDVFAIREHPIAALFPMLTEAELRDLGHDIQDRGLESPVVVCEVDGEWLLLDGRNRRAACRMVGAECTSKAYDRIGGHAGYVVSQNLKRRHMNDGQRSVVAAEIANYTHGGARADAPSKSPIGDLNPAHDPPVTQAEAAKLLNVTKRSVERARQVIKTGTPDHEVAHLRSTSNKDALVVVACAIAAEADAGRAKLASAFGFEESSTPLQIQGEFLRRIRVKPANDTVEAAE